MYHVGVHLKHNKVESDPGGVILTLLNFYIMKCFSNFVLYQPQSSKRHVESVASEAVKMFRNFSPFKLEIYVNS